MKSIAVFALAVWTVCGATVPLQPLAQQVRQLEEALNYLGQPLPAEHRQINDAIGKPDEAAAVAALETVLDRHALGDRRNQSRKPRQSGAGRGQAGTGGSGTRLFLVKVINHGERHRAVERGQPEQRRTSTFRSNGSPQPPIKLTPRDSADRWADISLYQRPPMRKRLSGLALEYQILEVYSRDAGQRSAKISFNVGQGSQDIGFRNDVTILFNAAAGAAHHAAREGRERPARRWRASSSATA